MAEAEDQSEAPYLDGDKVRLKSGGPVMTVRAMSQNLVYSVWFDDHQQLQSGTFAISELDRLPKDD